MNLNFKKIGEGQQTIIILHGVFGSLDNWGNIGKQIAEYGYTVYLVDQRNHGRSPHTQVHNYEGMAADLKEFIIQHNIQNPILIGHSMGGKTVMQFAANWPEVPSQLIVVDIGPKAYPLHHTRLIKGMKAMDLSAITSRQEADTAMESFENSIGVRQFLLKNLYRDTDNTFKWRFNLDLIERDMINVGQPLQVSTTITIPTLFIRGLLSNYILDDDWDQIHEIFPNAYLSSIPNAGHWVQAEQPQLFLETVINYLSNPV